MATKLSTFDFSAPSALTTGSKAVYPWEDWLDGDIWELKQGEDFTTHPLMMERIIRTRATTRGAKVQIRHRAAEGAPPEDPTGILILARSDMKGPETLKREEQLAKRRKRDAARRNGKAASKKTSPKKTASKRAKAPVK